MAVNPRYECRRLLAAVADQEAIYQVDNHFGHPDPPQMSVHPIKKDMLLVVAYTKHFVYADGLSAVEQSSQPRELCRLTNDDDECINCLTIVCLEDEHVILEYLEEETLVEDPNQSVDVSIDDETERRKRPKKKRSLLKGIITPSNSGTEYMRLAIVIGTSLGRVYSIEVRVAVDEGRLLTDEVPFLCEVLPIDDDRTVERLRERRRRRRGGKALVEFRPKGGVASLRQFRTSDQILHVWIVYKDGCMVRLHSAGFFPSVWQKGAVMGKSLDALLRKPALVRCKVFVGENAEQTIVVPLPKAHPSPLISLAKEPWQEPQIPVGFGEPDDEEGTGELTSEEDEDDEDEACFEAMVFSHSPGAPTLVFYTSEQQFEPPGGRSRRGSESSVNSDNPVIGAVVGGTKAIVGGVVGTALGALRWGLTGGQAESLGQSFDADESSEGDDPSRDDSVELELAMSPFPSLWHQPIELFAGHEFHDTPREVESCCIDPDGELAALSDNLGRVMLVDLQTKQVVRLWKGYRDATCSWTHTTRSFDDKSWQKKPHLNLVIHARHRRVVEVWRVRSGPRVMAMQVDRGCEILPFLVGSFSSHMAVTYLIQSRTPGSSLNQLEEVKTEGLQSVDQATQPLIPSKASTTPSSRVATLKLQHLRQLLSTSSVQFTADDVFHALREIKSLTDIAIALDLLAEAEILERRLGVDGSSFQKKALAYANDTLDDALTGKSKDLKSNPNVLSLSQSIGYHIQLIAAYDIIHKFELSPQEGRSDQRIKDPSHWVIEAMGWASMYQRVMAMGLDEGMANAQERTLLFCQFAAACPFPANLDKGATKTSIYFSDSSRTRRDILAHVFKPLLADAFSFKTLYSIFDGLKIRDDTSYLLKCFAEWVMTLSVDDLYQKGLLSVNSPLSRFLQDMASKQLERGSIGDDEVVLDVLYDFCCDSTDLVRANLLAVLSREAARKASSKKEKLTYGNILSSRVTDEWDALLRKLRVCLLVSLRLKNVRLAAPISIRTVEEEGLFSTYEWLALDELMMSHKHQEILSLEMACKVSSFGFDPSKPEGDGPVRFKALQNSCLAATIGEDERAEYLIDFDDEDRFGSLLLFLRSHNNPSLLAAHRARLLASSWCNEPSNLDVLRDACDALASLRSNPETIVLAVALCLDVWHAMCPILRGQLFGFEDIAEFNEAIAGPLLQDDTWFRGYAELALGVLEMIRASPWSDEAAKTYVDGQLTVVAPGNAWPPVRSDHILMRLIEKSRKYDTTAMDAHLAIVSALLVSKDVETLVRCVPGVYECFLPLSLFNPVAQPHEVTRERQDFLEDCIVNQAMSYIGPPMEKFDMGTIATLTRVWQMDRAEVNTTFLLTMYDAGRDRVVDDLLNKSSGALSVRRFVESGVDIACRRLHAFLTGKAMQSTDMRDTMGMLDADLCEWVKKRARESSASKTKASTTAIPIGQTHLLALRLLSLSASSNVETALRVKIHSLVVLSGTLVKVIEAKGRK